MSHELRRRTRDGVEQYLCKVCHEWKPKTEFHTRPVRYTAAGIHGSCKMCMRTKRRAYRAATRQRWQKNRNEKDRAERQKAREADKKGPPRVSFPAFVDCELLQPMVEALLSQFDGDNGLAAAEARTTSRTLYAIRVGERPTVRWGLAERIAIAAHMHNRFLDLFPLGVEGWNRSGDRYCRHCGRSDIRHAGRGYCLRCYQTAWYWEKKGGKMRQPIHERWMRSDEFMRCIRCKSMKNKHAAYGLCCECYPAVQRSRDVVPDAMLYRKHIERCRAKRDASRARIHPLYPSPPPAAPSSGDTESRTQAS